jgi:serine carboxypeptidase-like clade 2
MSNCSTEAEERMRRRRWVCRVSMMMMMMMMRVTLMAMVSSALIMCCVVERVHGAVEEHLVTNLPGQPVVTFKQYAGYINVNEATGKELFYWFVEADHKHAASLPIAFWFNGGKTKTL